MKRKVVDENHERAVRKRPFKGREMVRLWFKKLTDIDLKCHRQTKECVDARRVSPRLNPLIVSDLKAEVFHFRLGQLFGLPQPLDIGSHISDKFFITVLNGCHDWNVAVRSKT